MLILRGGVQGDGVQSVWGCQFFQREKSSSQWEMHGANLEKQSALGAPWVGCPHPWVGAAEKAEQRALEDGFGGQSKCGKRVG